MHEPHCLIRYRFDDLGVAMTKVVGAYPREKVCVHSTIGVFNLHASCANNDYLLARWKAVENVAVVEVVEGFAHGGSCALGGLIPLCSFFVNRTASQGASNADIS